MTAGAMPNGTIPRVMTRGMSSAPSRVLQISQALPAGFIQGNRPTSPCPRHPRLRRVQDYGASITMVSASQGRHHLDHRLPQPAHPAPTTTWPRARAVASALLVHNHKHYVYQELRAVSTCAGRSITWSAQPIWTVLPGPYRRAHPPRPPHDRLWPARGPCEELVDLRSGSYDLTDNRL